MKSPSSARWSASPVAGSQRGRSLRVPTINLDLSDIPTDLREGIYACRVTLEQEDGTTEGPFMAAVHYGPRPVFQDTRSFEIHLIDATPSRFPTRVTIEVIARLRAVRDFSSVEALQKQMGKDIAMARKMLKE